MTAGTRPSRLPGWLLLNVAALSSSLAHIFVDSHIGLFGETSSSMSLLQASNIVLTCLVVACWVLCLASTTGTGRPGLAGAVILAAIWSFLANGLAAVVAAPPPADAFPFQDVTHLSNVVFGAMATLTTWREVKRSGTAWSWAWSGVAILLMVGLFVVQVVLSVPNL